MVIIQDKRYIIFTSDKMSDEEKIDGTSHEYVTYLLEDNQRSLQYDFHRCRAKMYQMRREIKNSPEEIQRLDLHNIQIFRKFD